MGTKLSQGDAPLIIIGDKSPTSLAKTGRETASQKPLLETSGDEALKPSRDKKWKAQHLLKANL